MSRLKNIPEIAGSAGAGPLSPAPAGKPFENAADCLVGIGPVLGLYLLFPFEYQHLRKDWQASCCLAKAFCHN
ncbi:MAG: hypothetical protein K8F91_23605 [Candidatus Obscuribacterales bacterium]|nr:hypothetical protein [Candidatus Obscuribacterales bacterium]